MYELATAGSWLMLPILICSIVAVAIIIERFWALRTGRVLPHNLVANTRRLVANTKLTNEHLRALRDSSPLGRILAVGLANRNRRRDVLKEIIEDVGRHMARDLGRFLNALGTITVVTPLLGLLGTVVDVIDVFNTISSGGVGDAAALAGGISQALITTAGGLSVAIPALMFHRYFRGKVDGLVMDMERQAIKFVEMLQAEARDPSVRTKGELR